MRRGTLLVVLFAAWIVATAIPATARTIVVDRARVDGDSPTVTASGGVDEPTKVWVQGKTRPPGQHVVISWAATCERGSAIRTRDGVVSGPAPVRRSIRLPYADPDSCTIAANAQLHGTGALIVTILARV